MSKQLVPELLDMMKAGVHFGHATSRWHPKMDQYIFAVRQGIHIIDLELTAKKMELALDFIQKQAARGKQVLWVATKKQAFDLVKQYAEQSHSPYVNQKWLGGTFTNFDAIQGLIKKMEKLEKQKKDGVLERYTKKEQLEFQREIERLEYMVGGIRTMKSLPGAVFMIDPKEDKTARLEATKRGVPVVSVVDTNINPDLIDYPIPGNDDALRSIELFCQCAAEAIKQGQAEYEQNKAQMEKQAAGATVAKEKAAKKSESKKSADKKPADSKQSDK